MADELFPIADRNKFAWPLAQAQFLRGWVTSQQGDRDAGIEQMLKAAYEPSSAINRPMLLTLRSPINRRALRTLMPQSARSLELWTRDARAACGRIYEPEIIRLRGEILLLQSRS